MKLSIEEWALAEVMLVQAFLGMITIKIKAIVLKDCFPEWKVVINAESQFDPEELIDLQEVIDDFITNLEDLDRKKYGVIMRPTTLEIKTIEYYKADFKIERIIYVRTKQLTS